MRNILGQNRRAHGLKLGSKQRRLHDARLVSAVEVMESRVMLTAATYTGIPTNGVNPNASAEASGTSFLSVFGGTTAGQVHGSIHQGYGAIEFGPTSAVFPPSGHQINSISSMSVTLFNGSVSGNFASTSGTFNIWYVPDNTTSFGSAGGLQFQTTDLPNGIAAGGVNGTQQLGIVSADLIGTFAWDGTKLKVAEQSTYNSIPSAVSSALIADLNSGTKFRIAITAAEGTVCGDIEGASSNPSFIALDPQVQFNVDESFNAQSAKVDASTYSVNEQAGTVSVQVDRVPGPSNDVSGTLSVNYATADGTGTNAAVAGTNYTSTSGPLSWAPNDTSPKTIVIPIADFQPQGGNKNFTVSLSGASLTGDPGVAGIVGSPSSATVTILDNNEKFSFGAADPTTYDVNEGAGLAWFSVIRSGLGTDAATVNYATSNGTALAGTNYTAATGSVTFAAGQRVATFSVPITSIAGANGDKTFTITLSGGTDGAPGNEGITYGTPATENIIDADPTVLVNNLSSSTGALSNIETGGPFSTQFGNLVGGTNANFTFLSYQIIEFSKSANASMYPASGFAASNLTNLSLKLFNIDNSGTHNGTPGNLNVYLITDSDATTPTSSFRYLTSDPAGISTQGNPIFLGTFSFNDTLGYDTYTASGSIPAAAKTALLNALNTGANFRLAYTPGTTTFVADFAGTQANETPVVSITAPTSRTTNVDQFDFSTSSYTVNENAGTATITVNRTYTPFDNPTSDAATIDYATSDASAIAGTNYTATSNTLHFAAGQTSATFTIPILAANPQGGDKTLTITLSNPTAAGTNTITAIGQGTASLTISDTNTTGTVKDLTSWSDHTTEISSTGPVADTFFDIFGSANTSPATYGIMDFNVQADGDPDGADLPQYLFNQTSPVTAINSITLGLVNEPFRSSSGTFDIYLVDGSNTDPSTLTYTAGPEGLNQDGQLGHKTLLGQVNYNINETSSAYTQFPLTNYNQAAINTLMGDINGNTNFRLVITSEASTTSGAFGSGGDTGGGTNFPSPPAPQAGFRGPQLTFNIVQAGLPAWLAPASQARWSSPSLSIIGNGTIISDPAAASPADAPAVHVDSATSQLTISPTTAGSTINIPSLSASNSGTVTVTAASSALLPYIMNIPSLSFASGGKLDLKNNELITSATPTAVESLLHSGSIFTSSAGSLGYKVVGGMTEVRFTLDGDANLDGHVNIIDFNALAGDFGSTSKLWADGDFDYNTAVNLLDLNAIATNFGKDVGGTYAAPVPEGALLSASPFSTAPVSSPAPAASTVSGNYSPASDLFGSTKTLAADVLS